MLSEYEKIIESKYSSKNTKSAYCSKAIFEHV